jgi:eukaryotic-like serine/threonine-protein kinase
VEIRRRVRGEEEPRTLISMNNLALLYWDQGKYAQAEALFSKVLAARQRVLGESNPDTLKTMDALARLYRVQGRYHESEILSTKAFEGRRRVLGEQHPDTLVSLNTISLLYLDLQRYPQAEASFLKLLEARRHVLGPDHPDTIAVLDSLGHLRLQQRRYEEAEAPLREALTRRKTRSRSTWERFDSESMLGASLSGQGKYAQAEPLLLSGYEGLANREMTIPAPSRTAVKEAGERIVRFYQDWAKPEKAAEWQARIQQRH